MALKVQAEQQGTATRQLTESNLARQHQHNMMLGMEHQMATTNQQHQVEQNASQASPAATIQQQIARSNLEQERQQTIINEMGQRLKDETTGAEAMRLERNRDRQRELKKTEHFEEQLHLMQQMIEDLSKGRLAGGSPGAAASPLEYRHDPHSTELRNEPASTRAKQIASAASNTYRAADAAASFGGSLYMSAQDAAAGSKSREEGLQKEMPSLFRPLNQSAMHYRIVLLNGKFKKSWLKT